MRGVQPGWTTSLNESVEKRSFIPDASARTGAGPRCPGKAAPSLVQTRHHESALADPDPVGRGRPEVECYQMGNAFGVERGET